ncbi:hypothetical protein [Pseudovibrio brasiliensis]|uniref:Chromosome partition protein Smc n=1 Tax=Pseudovibrio brasiliensis TaxID=1898042 RepID=A0ABX8ATZ6_9HYPH|nr:hypothetical protein [Pseudovibrio brasiliensis]QUS57171.1 hypothetical protein KGB56_07210 [Pseudovibrio brasiliensis]
MPVSNLTQGQEVWLAQVYKQLHWQLPDHSSLNEGLEDDSNLTAKEECKRLGQRLSKLDKGSRAVVNKGDHLLTDEDEEAFWEIGERLFKTVQRAKKLHGTLEQEDEPDNTELKSYLTAVQDLSAKMEEVAQNSFAKADELINTTLYAQVEDFRRTVFQTEAKRDELESWGVDLSEFDKAYEAANDTLTKMTTAVHGHDYNVLKKLVEKSSEMAGAFEASYQRIADEPERIAAEAAGRLRQISAGRLALEERLSGLEEAPALLELFQSLSQQLQTAEQNAQKSIGAENGRRLREQLSLCEQLDHDLKQAWLKASAQAQTFDDATDVTGEALHHIEELKGKLELAEQRLPDMKAGWAESGQYESILSACRDQLKQAQASLIASDVQEAKTKLEAIPPKLKECDHLVAQMQRYQSEVAAQLDRLTQDAEPWFNRLKDCEKLFEFGIDAAKYYRAFEREIIILNNNITLAEKHVDDGNTLLAAEAVATGEDNLKMLISKGEAALQHLHDKESS